MTSDIPMEPIGSRALQSDRQAPPVAVNRRSSVRQRAHSPAYASMRGKSTAIVLDLNEVLDISEEGMSFQSPVQMEFGRSLEFSLDLSETKAYLPASGRVIWSEPAGRTGVKFVRMSGPSLLQLKQWLFLNIIIACADYVAAHQQPPFAEAERPVELHAEPTISFPELLAPIERQRAAILTAVDALQQEVEQIGPDLNSALQLIAERTLTLTGATGAAIAISEGERMVCRASAGCDAPGLGVPLQVGSGFSGECVRSGLLLKCDDSETDERVDRESCRALAIRSIGAAPVRSGDAVIGLLEVFSPTPCAFGDGERIALQHLTGMILAAVQRALDAVAARARISEASARFAEAESSGKASAEPASVVMEISQPYPAESSSPGSSAGTTEDQPAPDLPAESPPSARSQFFWVGRLLILFAVVAALGGLTVLFVPSIRERVRAQSEPEATHPAASSGTSSPTAVDVSDLPGLQRLAEQGDATAQFALGAHYATGDGVTQDYSAAVHWFSLAAEQGHVVAQATLGAYYWAGRGVPQDLDKAYFWSILAQAGGDEASKYRVEALASRMTRAEIIAAQEQANEWLTQHSPTAKSSPSESR
jgi:GAF domain/Sel1 repeat/PilZ domain